MNFCINRILLIFIITNLNLTRASEVEVECDPTNDEFYGRSNETTCVLTDIVAVRGSVLLITNAEESKFERMHIYNSILHSFPSEIFNQLPNLKFLYVSSDHLRLIPGYSFINASNLDHLFLSNNKVQEIKEHTLSGLKQLKVLYMTRNKIIKIDPKAFNGLESLAVLNLGSNPIKVITQEMFEPLKELDSLLLYNCQLKSIDSKTFISLSHLGHLTLDRNLLEQLELELSTDKFRSLFVERNRLRNLTIRSNQQNTKPLTINAHDNQISKIGIDQNCNVRTLNLARNRLESLGDAASLVNLSRIDVSYNPVKNIEKIGSFSTLTRLDLTGTETVLRSDIFTTLKSLKSLNLANMTLTTFDLNWVRGLSNLTMLNIESNQLRELDYKDLHQILPSLRVIKLSHNQFNCTYLKRMLDYFQNNTEILHIRPEGDTLEDVADTDTSINGVTCARPKDMNKGVVIVLYVMLGVIGTGMLLFVGLKLSKRYGWKVPDVIYRPYNNLLGDRNNENV